MENQSPEQAEEVLTPEQIAQRKAQMLQFFKDQQPFLEEQKKYETLITEIDELRTRRIRAQVLMGQMLAPSQEEEAKNKAETKASQSDSVKQEAQPEVATH